MKTAKIALLALCGSILYGGMLCGCGGQNKETDTAGTESDVVTGTESDAAAGTNTVDGTESATGSGSAESGTESVTGSESTESGSEIQTEVTESETEEPTPEVTLIMVGDILLHTPVAESGLQEDGSYDFDAVFANMAEEISAADLALVNQEVIIGGTELGISGYPTFNAPYELGDALVDAGFDVILHATNHTLDKGKTGLQNCLDFWQDNYPEIGVVGVNESQEARDNEIYIYEQEGICIAVLNYTYGTNGIPLPADMPYAVNLMEKEKMAADIARAKEEADFVVVCPHWGTEYQLTPSAEQVRWTEFFAENGVDLVLGTHPHVIEPVEWIPREELSDSSATGGSSETAGNSDSSDSAGDDMLVYYSLGNFVNWTASSGAGIANRMVGGMAQVTIRIDENGEAYIAEYGVEPLICHLTEGTDGVTVYRMADYTEELAAENEIIRQDSAFSLEYCENLCEEVWGELWREE